MAGLSCRDTNFLACSLRTGFPLNTLEVNYFVYYMIIFVIVYDLTGSIQKRLVNLSFIPARWFIITFSPFDIHKRVHKREIISILNWQLDCIIMRVFRASANFNRGLKAISLKNPFMKWNGWHFPCFS